MEEKKKNSFKVKYDNRFVLICCGIDLHELKYPQLPV